MFFRKLSADDIKLIISKYEKDFDICGYQETLKDLKILLEIKTKAQEKNLWMWTNPCISRYILRANVQSFGVARILVLLRRHCWQIWNVPAKHQNECFDFDFSKIIDNFTSNEADEREGLREEGREGLGVGAGVDHGDDLGVVFHYFGHSAKERP